MTLIWRIFPTPKKKNLTSRIFCYLTCFHDFFYFSPKKKNLISRFFLLLLPKHSEKTRNLLLPLTEKFFLQINYLVISLVNVLLSRNFCHKSVRVNFCKFHTVPKEKIAYFHEIFGGIFPLPKPKKLLLDFTTPNPQKNYLISRIILLFLPKKKKIISESLFLRISLLLSVLPSRKK